MFWEEIVTKEVIVCEKARVKPPRYKEFPLGIHLCE